MDSNNEIYIQAKGKVILNKNKPVFLKELVEVYCQKEIEKKIDNIVYSNKQLSKDKANVISVLTVIKLIRKEIPNASIRVLGEPEILLAFKEDIDKKDRLKLFRLALVSFLLFIGSITAIVNFHSDVDMKLAHQTIYRVITGEVIESPLLLQIPYSLGIGVGMSVFFNHIFKKKINTEPSPLEVEMYLYQQNMDNYIKNNENYTEMKEKNKK
ncbi:stage V sporulation protein AB [Alkaliphilus pronyensis]|uniref:Stage V sporulation protein AB n=1 Tax=Alkaliphilus pronyensis TaxID=1482732 RepID=A0A6I0F7C8_9FIRM|nr:stage V sporulation protein AA [Alkaliphilus pronyensis]KAB3532788.1 stage V sporulation protein AB [Alkaliphilus pronyensis]